MLSYDMAARGGESLYEYLYRCIRHDIAYGALSAGEKLPSKRSLAKHLGVSLVTVEAAYRQLMAEGYVVARERSGYYVCELPPAAKIEGVSVGVSLWKAGDISESSIGFGGCAAGFSSKGLANDRPESKAALLGCLASGVGFSSENGQTSCLPADPFKNSPLRAVNDENPLIADFSQGSAATKLFPYSAWAKEVRGVLSGESSKSLAQAAMTAGSPQLRQAIADYLREYRGIRVSPDQIIIGAGSQVLYQLVVQLLGRDFPYAVETPGYPLLLRMYAALGVDACQVPLDNQGLIVGKLRECGARVAHVMPSHQLPTGVVMSASRRRELLNWAREVPGRYIIEDDYDSEFRMAGRPIAPLASIDAAGRVLYFNSFTKSLGDAFRMAYLVLPGDLAKKFNSELGFYSNTVSPLDQLALASFIADGHYERHVSRLRTHARRAQDSFVGALKSGPLAGKLRFSGLNGGLHFVMSLEDSRGEDELANLALRAGVALSPMGAFCDAAVSSRPAFVLRYDGSDAATAECAAHALERAWD